MRGGEGVKGCARAGIFDTQSAPGVCNSRAYSSAQSICGGVLILCSSTCGC